MAFSPWMHVRQFINSSTSLMVSKEGWTDLDSKVLCKEYNLTAGKSFQSSVFWNYNQNQNLKILNKPMVYKGYQCVGTEPMIRLCSYQTVVDNTADTISVLCYNGVQGQKTGRSLH